MSTRFTKRVLAGLTAASLVVLGTVGNALAQDFDLDALVAAAKQEAPINIYDSTGKIVEMADAFSTKYGVKATGIKVSANSQLEMIIREAQANNVQGDVLMLTDAPASVAQLLPQQFVYSWLPPDMADKVPERFHDPLAITTNASVWAYNTEVYDKCPVTNMWELTKPEWKGHVAFYDPLLKGTYPDWFNQMATHFDSEMRDAYKAAFGNDLETDEASATAAWVKAFAANGPLISDGDDPIAEAIGAPGQKQPFFGLLSSAKFRDNADKGYKLGLCTDMQPWIGSTYVKAELIATGTKSPNAARLFVYYSLTDEGMKALVADSNIPTNKDIALPKDNPSGLFEHVDQLLAYDLSTSVDDFDAREDWGDFWTLNYK